MSAKQRLNLRNQPMTPKSSELGPTTPIVTPKSCGSIEGGGLRRELFQGGTFGLSPGWKSAVGSTLLASPTKKGRPIPDHFKQQMPTSARKKMPEPGPPSCRFAPIVKTSFYGSPSAGPSLHNSSTESNSSPNIESQRPPLKQKNSKDKKSDALRAKTALKQRSKASGRISKKKAVGFNKGVSHAIKKPSKKQILKKIKQREEKLKRQRLQRHKENVREVQAASASFKKSFFEDLVDDEKVLNKKARKSGKLSLNKQTNVSYTIKNGQPVFHLRRSPRKCYLNDDKPVLNRTTPKLFTPSGSQDYLAGSSPLRKRPRTVPSPIKFDHSNEECEMNDSVRNIIDTLGDDEASTEDVNVSQDEYAVYVDELEKVAMDTVNELAEIGPPEDTNDTIQSILENMAPITEDEINERRQVAKKNATPRKTYPVFERITRSRSCTPTKRNNKKEHALTTDVDKEGLKQTIIDAGQKVIGHQYCMVCDFVYTAGDADEERLHDEKHAQVVGIIKFQGWRNENKIEHHDGRIVIVGPNDNKRHWEKVQAVLEVVDTLLGISDESGSTIRSQRQSKAFMFVTEGRIVGLLFAEILDKSDRVSVSSLAKEKQRVLKDIFGKQRQKVGVGITRIWVSTDYQRKQIASRMVDAMRANFLPVKVLGPDEFAFSHTTPAGSEFASKYVNSSDFLTYAPVLHGQPITQ